MKYKRLVMDSDSSLVLEDCNIQDLLSDPQVHSLYVLGDIEPFHELIEAMQFLGDMSNVFPPRIVDLTPSYSGSVSCSALHIQIVIYKHTHAVLVEEETYSDDDFVLGRLDDIVIIGTNALKCSDENKI